MGPLGNYEWSRIPCATRTGSGKKVTEMQIWKAYGYLVSIRFAGRYLGSSDRRLHKGRQFLIHLTLLKGQHMDIKQFQRKLLRVTAAALTTFTLAVNAQEGTFKNLSACKDGAFSTEAVDGVRNAPDFGV